MPRRDLRHRAGFTLVEVVVALAISGLVLLAARQMLEALAAGADRLSAAARAADREANADRLLRALVGRLEVGTQEAGEFAGAERAASFTSWCDAPGGWQERCAVTLAIDSAAVGRPVLAVSIARPGGPPGAAEVLVLRDGFADGAFRYLSDAGAGGTWFRAWGRGVTTPLAIGVILVREPRPGADSVRADTRRAEPIRADTLILRIGERG